MKKQQRQTPMTDPLRQAVIDCELSTRQLARECGLNHASLVRFVQGKSLRLDKADRLATYFGLSLQPDNPKGE